MDVREKLVELLQSAPADIIGNHGIGALAYHLCPNRRKENDYGKAD